MWVKWFSLISIIYCNYCDFVCVSPHSFGKDVPKYAANKTPERFTVATDNTARHLAQTVTNTQHSDGQLKCFSNTDLISHAHVTDLTKLMQRQLYIPLRKLCWLQPMWRPGLLCLYVQTSLTNTTMFYVIMLHYFLVLLQ